MLGPSPVCLLHFHSVLAFHDCRVFTLSLFVVSCVDVSLSFLTRPRATLSFAAWAMLAPLLSFLPFVAAAVLISLEHAFLTSLPR